MKLFVRVLPLVGIGFAFVALRGPAAPAYVTQTDAPVHPHAALLRSAESLGYHIPEVRFQGASSCASMGCHNGGVKQHQGSEFSTWAGHDPHFNAYNVLFNARSKHIVRVLNHLPAEEEQHVAAHREAACLKCHTTDVPAAWHGQPPLQVEAADAVACEACHGAAERYKTVHYLDEWKTLNEREKAERFGLYPTKDLAFRVRMCASCHLGQEGWDVNHELIAAGHPALRFEYTSQHFSPKYTRHWNESNYGPDFDLRAWEIGQLASAKSAIELMIWRTSRDWPELAEFNCFSCHHDLEPKEWAGALPKKPLGALRWGTWYYGLTASAAGDLPKLDALVQRMNKPGASVATVKATAAEALREIDAKLRALQCAAVKDSRAKPYTADQVRVRLRDLAAMSAPPTWDAASQRYLAAGAMYHTLTDLNPAFKDDKIRSALSATVDVLRFPKGYNNPADLFTPARFRDSFQLLEQRLAP